MTDQLVRRNPPPSFLGTTTPTAFRKIVPCEVPILLSLPIYRWQFLKCWYSLILDIWGSHDDVSSELYGAKCEVESEVASSFPI